MASFRFNQIYVGKVQWCAIGRLMFLKIWANLGHLPRTGFKPMLPKVIRLRIPDAKPNVLRGLINDNKTKPNYILSPGFKGFL